MTEPTDKNGSSAKLAASVPTPLPPADLPQAATADSLRRRHQDDKIYEETRKELLKLEHDTAQYYDRWILSLAGIALGFSLSVVKDFIKPASNAALHEIDYLYAAWVLFGAPLALIMFNLQVSYSASKKYRSILDSQYEMYDDTPEFWNNVRQQMRRVWRIKLIEFFNWVSLLSFLCGIGCLVAFVWINVR
jgi:hypothetical protein